MSYRRSLAVILSALMLLTTVSTAPAQDDPKSPARLWEDFTHYVLVVNEKLAVGSAQALLQAADEQKLLDIVEASSHRDDYQRILDRAAKTESLRDLALQVGKKIEDARLARARDAKRIAADIQQLASGGRPQQAAIARLRAAGQYAAPQLLAVLTDDQQAKLHPYVINALVAVGRPVVYPLSVAFTDLDPRAMSQVARVLAEIGYPRALPYLKQAIEDKSVNAEVRAIVQNAFEQLARTTSIPADASAAQLMLVLGQNLYSTATSAADQLPGYDPATGKGLVWAYKREVGLVANEVPGAVHGDVLAMQVAQHALRLDPSLDSALSLWLTANLRRENRLPQGQIDPSYSKSMRPAAFYARMAGPVRLNEVLARALRDNDADLALDAIQALATTVNPETLIARGGASQPLIQALYYPNRNVRFAAAFALANGQPVSEFPGSFRVVPVLAEAVRQTGAKAALVVAPELGAIRAEVPQTFVTEGAASLSDIATVVAAKPGFDLIIVQGSADAVEAVYQHAAQDYRLRSLPIVAVTSESDALEIARAFDRRDIAIRAVNNIKNLPTAIEQVLAAHDGGAITEEQAAAFAAKALATLREIALSRSLAFKSADAQAALLEALSDARPEIATQAARVLALLPSDQAQRAVADAALSADKAPELRVALLGSLAESATAFGNRLDAQAVAKLQDLVRKSEGDLAIAASTAHGALALPTADAIKLITNP